MDALKSIPSKKKTSTVSSRRLCKKKKLKAGRFVKEHLIRVYKPMEHMQAWEWGSLGLIEGIPRNRSFVEESVDHRSFFDCSSHLFAKIMIIFINNHNRTPLCRKDFVGMSTNGSITNLLELEDVLLGVQFHYEFSFGYLS